MGGSAVLYPQVVQIQLYPQYPQPLLLLRFHIIIYINA